MHAHVLHNWKKEGRAVEKRFNNEINFFQNYCQIKNVNWVTTITGERKKMDLISVA